MSGVKNMNGSVANDLTIKVGISTCLLGEKVRFDGGHKKDRYITDILGDYFEWVQVCPELEVGMGIPREAVRLVGDTGNPRMVGTKSETDWTERIYRYSGEKINILQSSNLSGYIFKSDSPSCGMERVRIYTRSGMPSKSGRGLFAAAVMERFPLLPVEEEGRLNDARLRENFIERIFSYYRLQQLTGHRFSVGELVRFHTVSKYLLLSHSVQHYQQLGKLVANSRNIPFAELREIYSRLFMEGLKVKTTTKKNVNVLQHIFGYLRDKITPEEKKDILLVLEDYRKEITPLVVPLTLIRHYVHIHDIGYIKDQLYLNPHPKELMLRNHV